MPAPDARYDGHASWYDAAFGWMDTGSEWWRLVEDLLMTGPGAGRCLDLGCGTGRAFPIIASAGYRPVGVDVSGDQLAIAATRAAPVVRANATRLPFADGSFAAVLAAFVHTDVDDWTAAVAEMARVLIVDGRLVCLAVHPCYVGTFTDRRRERHEQMLHLERGYGHENLQFGRPGKSGLTCRVGRSDLTLTTFLNAFLSEPALHTLELQELDTTGGAWSNPASDGRVAPWNMAVVATRRGRSM